MFRTLILGVCLLCGCTGLPKGVQPVKPFDLQRYLGNWYEIARLDHRFERGLSRVTAHYSLREDGGVSVVNRGFSEADRVFEKATGRAYFKGDGSTGHLKVSFFGPFYGSYVVFELDPDYRYAFVAGYNQRYLWLLSRTPSVDEALYEAFVASARERGFDTDSLIRVDQSPVK